ncbi:sulfotransferase family 2 domain-containing protein [Campylobacter canadensis]|uniref:sulfotransferase family protein n=2 Tax=Campylobacter canadensis TaxID=449520 RepID=UPI001CCC364F|nr:sulfotransferase family protein [Campylobacter canadensis]MBZ7995602.1 sulfotransferase family 2 domain-containing protein [Campylobacter canadensis]MBZ8000838.1 sulfotransferase family 2 domain-containing protein [Campylobacter canadensis]MBZ8002772.1 sulfotransferase family 2 domain-containing protein [Campylobacter canadensis]
MKFLKNIFIKNVNMGGVNKELQKMKNQELKQFFDISAHTANYLLNISTKNKYIYFETPKVACSSVKKTLQNLEIDYDIDLSLSPHDKKQSPLKSPFEIDNFTQCMQEYFKFSFVRNPYTRTLSCFLQKFLNENKETRMKFLNKININEDIKLTFIEFLTYIKDIDAKKYDIHFMPQHLLLGKNIKLDFIGKFENFENDFKKVLKIISKNKENDIINVTWHSTNADDKSKDFLTKDCIKLINEIYYEDFKRFNYEML